MANIDMNAIFKNLTRHINDQWYEKAYKKNPEFAQAVKAITVSDISIGDPPTLRRGYVEGSSTGVGKSQQGDTTYTRTVSISFNTEEYFFAEKYDVPLANYALSVLGAHSKCHTPAEASNLAEKYGKTQCRNDLNDLNYSMSEYRLNRYKLIYTDDAFKPPVYPVCANIRTAKGEENICIGHYYIKNDDEYVDWSIHTPMTDKKKMIIGGIIAAAVIVAAVLLFAL